MEVHQREDQGRLHKDDGGNADHEGEVLGLVADEPHGDEHGHRAAYSRPDEQGFFGDAEFHIVPLGDLLVVDAGHDGAERDYGYVSEEDQPEQGKGQIRHGDAPFRQSVRAGRVSRSVW